MSIPPAGPGHRELSSPEFARGLGRFLRLFSVFTMLMTIPQVVAVWGSSNVTGVSVLSWIAYLVSAGLWLVYGVAKRDKTIYLACVGWIVLDAAVVIGVLVNP